MTVHASFVAAVKALAPSLTVHDGAVPALPKSAYVLIEAINRRPLDRAMSRDRHGSENRWRLTIASNAPAGVLAMSIALDPLDGTRVLGHRVEEIDTGMGVTEDDSVVTEGAPRWYTKREFRLPQPI